MGAAKATAGPWHMGGIFMPGSPYATTGIWGPTAPGNQSGTWITAAPELYEALKALVDGLEGTYPFEGLPAARAAIAAAEGANPAGKERT